VDGSDLEPVFRMVYRYRSKALHAGTPFPHPMCRPPREAPDAVPAERPEGLGAWAFDASWTAEDTPILLGTFAYIVRGALLAWWSTTLIP
jgi:hypothetical protein